ncbi:IS3 family transposase [Corynebacterium pilosum]|uniref:IS3 family transposase n=2 Tax=Corynebacterium pilosum TaxID=35756 RepID=UPI000E1BA4C5|nr:IS3 family transposase [Corynebacterium pilosum]
MKKSYDPEFKTRAVRMVQQHREDYRSLTATCTAIGNELGVSRETLRNWVRQAEVDAGTAPGVTTEENEEMARLRKENKRLREANEILKKATGFLRRGTRPPKPLIVDFIDQMRDEGFAVESICRVLREQGVQVAARTYRYWKKSAPATRTVTDAQILNALHDLKGTPESLYGRRKMVAYLRRQGHAVAHCTVDRLMRLAGMNGISRRRTTVRTTIPGAEDRAPDRLNRDFTAEAPNRVWVADFTYVRTTSGWVYVAFIVDVYSQRIVGWHAQTSRGVELVRIPLRLALWERDRTQHPVVPGELTHHSDAGSQYTAVKFTENLALQGITPSIGSVGDAYDNALMESINGLYKTECIGSRIFTPERLESIVDVELATMSWVQWYNTRRLHSTLGMVPPAEHEETYWAGHATITESPERVAQPI